MFFSFKFQSTFPGLRMFCPGAEGANNFFALFVFLGGPLASLCNIVEVGAAGADGQKKGL